MQKGYSLRHQEEKLRNYCFEQGYNILQLYKEDYSAKTFNRPTFKRFFSFCKRRSNKLDMLIFTKWDRFSSNAGEALQMVKDFHRMGVVVHSTDQPIDLSISE